MISYGQVMGYKHPADQEPYDPANPKPSRYAPKKHRARSLAIVTARRLRHGASAYMGGRCDCEVCRKAYEDKRERDRLQKRAKAEALHLNDERTEARCIRCWKWKPVSEFPRIGTHKRNRWVCGSCLPERSSHGEDR